MFSINCSWHGSRAWSLTKLHTKLWRFVYMTELQSVSHERDCLCSRAGLRLCKLCLSQALTSVYWHCTWGTRLHHCFESLYMLQPLQGAQPPQQQPERKRRSRWQEGPPDAASTPAPGPPPSVPPSASDTSTGHFSFVQSLSGDVPFAVPIQKNVPLNLIEAVLCLLWYCAWSLFFLRHTCLAIGFPCPRYTVRRDFGCTMLTHDSLYAHILLPSSAHLLLALVMPALGQSHNTSPLMIKLNTLSQIWIDTVVYNQGSISAVVSTLNQLF